MSGVTDMPFRALVNREKAWAEKMYERDVSPGIETMITIARNLSVAAGCEPHVMAESGELNEDRGAALINQFRLRREGGERRGRLRAESRDRGQGREHSGKRPSEGR